MSSRLPQIGLACFVVGCLLVFLIDVSVARIVGVPLIFTGILVGIRAIATPDFLKGDREAQPERTTD